MLSTLSVQHFGLSKSHVPHSGSSHMSISCRDKLSHWQGLAVTKLYLAWLEQHPVSLSDRRVTCMVALCSDPLEANKASVYHLPRLAPDEVFSRRLLST